MTTNLTVSAIETKIFTLRGVQVMIDRDLAELYGVETKVFNQAVKRNIDRFPDDFRFQLTNEESIYLRSQNVTSSSEHGGRRYLPYAFTEQGVSMLSAVLKSDTAVTISVNIIRTFVQMRRYMSHNSSLFQRVGLLEAQQKQTNEKIDTILNAIEDKSIQPKQGIFYNGQIFDAYTFVSDLIRQAKQRIILIDNYIDDTTLTHLSAKANENVTTTILTKSISKAMQLDLQKHNAQYKPITLVTFNEAHDRFLIIDETVYHIGASLKDLGKKWFAFSRIEGDALHLLEKVQNVLVHQRGEL